MTHDEPLIQPKRDLLRKAKNLQGWCLSKLREREGRTDQEIIEIGRAIQIWAFEGEFDEESVSLSLIYMWERFADGMYGWTEAPALIEKEFGIVSTPPWEPAEIVLVPGLILAEFAVKYLQSETHSEHLLAANLMIDATEAANYWQDLRGKTRCRIPDEKWAKVFRTIERKEFESKYRAIVVAKARIAANAKHSKPGGSRDKKSQIREKWASGKYASRDICAEQECAAIGMSFAAARRALRNIPKPT